MARRRTTVHESEVAEREVTANEVGTVPVARSGEEDEKACAQASVPAVSGRMQISAAAGVEEDEGDAGTCALRSSYYSRNVRCTDTN